jgi:hypothetical protein
VPASRRISADHSRKLRWGRRLVSRIDLLVTPCHAPSTWPREHCGSRAFGGLLNERRSSSAHRMPPQEGVPIDVDFCCLVRFIGALQTYHHVTTVDIVTAHISRASARALRGVPSAEHRASEYAAGVAAHSQGWTHAGRKPTCSEWNAAHRFKRRAPPPHCRSPTTRVGPARWLGR